MTVRKVLLATDGSEQALKAAAFLNGLVAGRTDCKVTVLHVLPVPRIPAAAAAGAGVAPLPDVPVDVMIDREAKPVLARTVAALDLPQEQVREEVQLGDAADEIVRVAKAMEADMIVMGNRGLSPIKEFFLGSVSDRVAQKARCPVLIVK